MAVTCLSKRETSWETLSLATFSMTAPQPVDEADQASVDVVLLDCGHTAGRTGLTLLTFILLLAVNLRLAFG